MKTNSKQSMRAQLEAGMSVFLSQGKEITKLDAAPKRGEKKAYQPKEKVVEIEVEFLPQALQTKYFGT